MKIEPIKPVYEAIYPEERKERDRNERLKKMLDKMRKKENNE